jgi:hypothetical protein
MRINLKTFFTGISVALNVIFIAGLIIAALSDNVPLYFPAPRDGSLTAAAIAQFPASSTLIFSPVEFALKPGEKAVLQYSVITAKKQNNVLINALYDPEIINVAQTVSGIEITALREGETLMQTISNEGIKDIALITITK